MVNIVFVINAGFLANDFSYVVKKFYHRSHRAVNGV